MSESLAARTSRPLAARTGRPLEEWLALVRSSGVNPDVGAVEAEVMHLLRVAYEQSP